MESDNFGEWIRGQDNAWIYASNITEFHYFDLEFSNPANVVIAQQISPYSSLEILDLATLGGGAVKVKFEIPLRVERMDK
jgi:hypothetical protein